MKSRRNFIKVSGAALGGAALLNNIPMQVFAKAQQQSESIGFQVWTIRKELVADFPGTLTRMAGMGYREVEMCSPLGYSDAGFEPLNRMSGTEIKKIVEDAGLTCTSAHFNMGELRDHLADRINWANELGMKQMIAASFWLPNDASIDDYRRAADELNAIGEKTKKEGIQMGFHNHHMEFEKRNNELIYDALLDQVDPELVKMQFQVAVVDIGYKAEEYFRKYPGRFISAHLADYSSESKKQVPVGQGIVDWKELFRNAKTGGVKNFYVEMDPEYFSESAKFLLKG